MCGISGIIFKNKNEKISDYCILLLKYLHNRGTDDKNLYINKNNSLGLCHNRLSIVDLSLRSRQPFVFKNLIIIFNGEIYNYKVIKIFLIQKYKCTFLTTSDTEVLIQLFYYEGIDECLKLINGIFAIGLYNTDNEMLYLIRDRIGIKYLYYYFDSEKFIFASNPAAIAKTLYDVENKKWNIDFESLFSYISSGICLSKKTLFENIIGLDTGSYIKFSLVKNNFEIVKWWKPNFKRNDEDLEFYIKKSVELQETGDVTKNILFSGGIDSCILAHYSKESDLLTLDFGELKYAKKFCEISNKNLKIINSEFLDKQLFVFIDEQRKIINFTGIPVKSSYIMNMSSLFIKNTMKNTKILLCGIGGNELFYGHRRIKFDKSNFNNHLKDLFIFLYQIKPLDNKYKNNFIEFKNNINERIYKEIEVPDDLLSENIPRWLEYKTFLLNDLLINADSIYMFYSIEARVPLLDHNIFEISFSKKPSDFFYNFENVKKNPSWDTYTKNSKKPLKNILSNILSKDFLEKEKYSYDVERHKIHPLYINLCNNFLNRKIIGWNGEWTKYNSHLIGNIEIWMQEFEYLLEF